MLLAVLQPPQHVSGRRDVDGEVNAAVTVQQRLLVQGGQLHAVQVQHHLVGREEGRQPGEERGRQQQHEEEGSTRPVLGQAGHGHGVQDEMMTTLKQVCFCLKAQLHL